MRGMSKAESARERWERIVREQRRSGRTVAAFCVERGIAESSFYPWKRRLAGSAGTRGEGGEGALGPEPAFVEAKVGGDDPGKARGRGGVRIALRGGVRVLVRRGFDRDLLREVIEAIGGRGVGERAAS
jgi:hypothetical protein